jgi:hypothetical protein
MKLTLKRRRGHSACTASESPRELGGLGEYKRIDQVVVVIHTMVSLIRDCTSRINFMPMQLFYPMQLHSRTCRHFLSGKVEYIHCKSFQ